MRFPCSMCSLFPVCFLSFNRWISFFGNHTDPKETSNADSSHSSCHSCQRFVRECIYMRTWDWMSYFLFFLNRGWGGGPTVTLGLQLFHLTLVVFLQNTVLFCFLSMLLSACWKSVVLYNLFSIHLLHMICWYILFWHQVCFGITMLKSVCTFKCLYLIHV